MLPPPLLVAVLVTCEDVSLCFGEFLSRTDDNSASSFWVRKMDVSIDESLVCFSSSLPEVETN